jgi:hypothetical protein
MTDHLDDEQLNALADRIRLGTQHDAGTDPLREHLEGCSECRARFGRLAKLLNVADTMPRRVEPPVDLWPSIRATIEDGADRKARDAERDSQSTQHPLLAGRQLRVSFAVAAAVVLAIVVGKRIGDRSNATPRSPVAATATSPSAAAQHAGRELLPASAVTTLDTADLHAEEELMAALELRRSALRPSTSAQIDSSLRVIDTAIAELEAARARDPNNQAILQLLAVSRARKLELLKQAQNAS